MVITPSQPERRRRFVLVKFEKSSSPASRRALF
nr:MAG TPA: hypothetical protein [Caudoviricetes sp.]